ncbi:MAG TPA: very short patch repair endonuclease [bacterium]|nr:very short patch repair endonuclease [bacterium]
MDFVDTKTRSRMMSTVRGKDTQPELEIRRSLFAMGFRYRLHRTDLPGKPDLVFPKYSAVLFIHGCFWHQHGCKRSSLPKTRRSWWKEKLERNHERDEEVVRVLNDGGWRVLLIWECSFRRTGINRRAALDEVVHTAVDFLHSETQLLEIPDTINDATD